MKNRYLTTKEHEILLEAIACKKKHHAITPLIEKKLNELEKWIDDMRCNQNE